MMRAFSTDATPSLHCRHLTLAQPVAIWFVRLAFEDGVEATERTARKVFRTQPIEQALAPLGDLVDALHQCPLEAPPVHPLRGRRFAETDAQSTQPSDVPHANLTMH